MSQPTDEQHHMVESCGEFGSPEKWMVRYAGQNAGSGAGQIRDLRLNSNEVEPDQLNRIKCLNQYEGYCSPLVADDCD